MKKILFVSGSIGLGHVGRDLEIAKALRELHREVEISWMAESPASEVLEEAGEKLLPEASLLSSANAELEGISHRIQNQPGQVDHEHAEGLVAKCRSLS